MLQIIIAVVLGVVAISVFITYESASYPKKNILLGVLLPPEFHKSTEVHTLLKQYRRGNISLLLVSMTVSIPVFFIPYTSFVILYIGLLSGGFFLVSNLHYKKYFLSILLLKSHNRWFIHDYEYHELTQDIEVMQHNWIRRVYKRLFPTWKEQLLAKTNEPIYVDEDEYWINGYYYNPDDSKAVVEKRVGAGMTSNLATAHGKLAVYGGMIFTVLVLGFVFLLFAVMDFSTFQITINTDTASIEAPIYDYEFNIGDIEQIILTDTLPKSGIRTNGAATDNYSLGNFHFDEYGSSKVFIYTKYPPYIIIRLQNKTVFINTKTQQQTKQYYQQLLVLWNECKEQ